jgi:serine/threonine-protein kinase
LIGGIIGLIAVTFWGWQLMTDNNNPIEATATVTTTAPAVVELATETAAPEASSTLPPPTMTATQQPTNTPTVLPSATSTSIPTPTPQAGATRVITLPGGLEVTQVFVPAGSFLMGSDRNDPNAFEDQFPQHEVSLDSFWIDQTEVTNIQFAAFLNEQGNQEEGGVRWLAVEASEALIESRDGAFQPKAGFDDHPVIEVSWYGAQAHCEWSGGRLPTEAEWEYAARGPDNPIYPWGDEFDETRLNFCDESCEFDWRDATVSDGYERTAPVGTYPEGASWIGALNMSGNVWEWVNDWYDSSYYQNSPSENPTGPDSGSSRVLRGGAWLDSVQYVRAAFRISDFSIGPDFRSLDVGFRCAQE